MPRTSHRIWGYPISYSLPLLAVWLICSFGRAAAQTEATENQPAAERDAPGQMSAEEYAQNYPHNLPKLPPPEEAKAMPEPHRVWVDREKKLVYVDGYVSLREGMLEMFACPTGTKEHESVVAVVSSAQVVHACLLAVGAEPGTPVQFRPEFKAPTGTIIDIEVRWRDEEEQWHSLPAQQWVRNVRTEKPMEHPWVFAGSQFYKDEETGDQIYMAEAGDLICVSNFSTATLDIPTESSQVNAGLMFEANAEKIPPLGTPVRLVLKPRTEDGKPVKEGAEKNRLQEEN